MYHLVKVEYRDYEENDIMVFRSEGAAKAYIADMDTEDTVAIYLSKTSHITFGPI